MTYRERRAARAERLRDWAGTNQTKSARALTTAHTIADAIPFGQPILVGHHSEKHARRDQERIHNNMRRGLDLQEKAATQASRADEIDRQAERAIYSDDHDAIERLTEKIAQLEADRERMKAANAAYKKGDAAFAAQQGITLAQAQARRVTIEQAYSWCRRPYPAYELQNLGGNITRARKRLASLQGPTPPADAPPPAGETATARAGLVVTASTTTPRASWKQPRPVWNVTGNLGPWRAMLLGLDGSWYRGAFSFYEDPTEAIEQATAEAEQAAREGGE